MDFINMGLVEIFLIILGLCIALYYYNSSKYEFWKKLGVPGPKPTFLLGNFKDLMLRKKSFGDFIKQLYDDYKNEPIIGIYARHTPILILNDPDLIKDVLIKDFANFTDRGIKIYEKVEPLAQNLFSLEHERWRPLRIKLSPTFTSGKLKEMFYLLLESGDNLEKYMKILIDRNEPIEIRDLTSKYTTNVIGACAFGLNINVLCDEESEFLKMGKQIFTLNNWRQFKATIRDTFPKLFNFLGPLMKDWEINNFYKNLFINMMKYRKENNIVRHDFVDLLREIRENPEKLGDFEITDDIIVAQAFVFLVAGFETSSTTMSHALYELALNPSIQDKLRKEIHQVLNKSDGILTYEIVKSMKYLHQIFQETLRKYPPVTALMRKSTENYKFSKINVTIPKDMILFLPIYGIQLDSKYYPNPDKFDPERFNDENFKSRHPMHFLPFGDGPRNCIGSRFAIFQTKVGLIKMLKNFRVDVCEKTLIPYVTNVQSFLLAPEGGIYLKLSKVSSE